MQLPKTVLFSDFRSLCASCNRRWRPSCDLCLLTFIAAVVLFLPSCRLVATGPKKAKNSFSVQQLLLHFFFIHNHYDPIFHNSIFLFYSSSRIAARDFGIFRWIHIRQSHWCPMHVKTILSSGTTGFFHQRRTGKFGHICIYAQYLGNSPFGPWARYFISFLLMILWL